jgi:hypothetical protein
MIEITTVRCLEYTMYKGRGLMSDSCRTVALWFYILVSGHNGTVLQLNVGKIKAGSASRINAYKGTQIANPESERWVRYSEPKISKSEPGGSLWVRCGVRLGSVGTVIR